VLRVILFSSPALVFTELVKPFQLLRQLLWRELPRLVEGGLSGLNSTCITRRLRAREAGGFRVDRGLEQVDLHAPHLLLLLPLPL
jgi:hypothetical protein